MAAPIAFLAFNRPTHMAKSLAALAADPLATEAEIHIFIDGPRNERDVAGVEAAASVAGEPRPFKRVLIHRAESNRGLFRSITGGVDTVLRESNRVIVMEDDLVVAP